MIPFNVPPCVGDELDYVKQAIDHYDLFNPNAAAPVMDVED